MTDQPDSRATGMVTAVMDDDEQSHLRRIIRPVGGPGAADRSGSGTADVADSEADIAPRAYQLTDSGRIILPTPEILNDPEAVADLVAAQSSLDDEAGDPEYPHPPVRASLDDDDLIPLVVRHTDDTATIDLIGIIQAQMQLRTREAEDFAVWEERMRQIGTAAALGEIERTRLHFTGVIPVQQGRPLVTANDTPRGPARLEAVPVEKTHEEAPIVSVGSIPSATDSPAATAPLEADRAADAAILDRDDMASWPTPVAVTGRNRHDRPRTRILVPGLAILAALFVIAALVLTAVTAPVPIGAAAAAVGMLAASWLGVVVGRLARRRRPRENRAASPRSSRTAWAVVAGLVVGTAVGEGLVRTSAAGFSWQGYLLKRIDVSALDGQLSVVSGMVAALVLAFVIVVLVGRAPTAGGQTS